MELYLDNIGIIRDSKILLDGLTVITGKNSSGKTTVGKVMYSLLSAGADLEEAFEFSKKRYIVSKLADIERILKLRRYRRLHREENNDIFRLLDMISMHAFARFSLDDLILFLSDTKEVIIRLEIEDYLTYIGSNQSYNNLTEAINQDFPQWKQKCVDICETALLVINDENAFYNFVKARTDAFINHEFSKQIKPIRCDNCESKIELYEKDKCIVKAAVKDKNKLEFSSESTFLYSSDNCIFIDNPYVIDRLDKNNFLSHSMYEPYEENEVDAIITSDDIKDHDEILSSLIIDNPKNSYFDDLEIQNKFKNVFSKINEIVPGEFLSTEDGYFYVKDGKELSVKNLATGSKMFFIIKKLLFGGLIDSNTMLILDEPESHLHPEWINKFAEILVYLTKDVKVKILITTHSPNLMLALSVFAKKMEMNTSAHFYIAENIDDEYFSQIRCIDDSIEEGYAHLSIPFVKMNLEMKGIQNGVSE